MWIFSIYLQYYLFKILSFPCWMILASLSKKYFTMYVKIISGLSILFYWLICLFMPVLYCVDYCHVIVSFEIRICENSNFVQDCLGYLGVLWDSKFISKHFTLFFFFFNAIVNGMIRIFLSLAQWELTSALYQCKFWAHCFLPFPQGRDCLLLLLPPRSQGFIWASKIEGFPDTSLMLFFA